MVKSFLNNNKENFYFVFRLLVGIVFLLHGIAKIGMYADGKIALMSLFGLAMVIEIIVGLFIIIGLLTQWSATIGAIEMLVALFKAHFPSGINPLGNGGEAAVLFFAAFLVLAAYGAGKWAVDKK